MRQVNTTVRTDYTRDELILTLGRIRRRPISIPTFYRWLDKLSITPKLEYPPEDASRLVEVAQHFARGGNWSNCKSA